MTLREWLLNFDCGYLHCEVWIDGEEEVAYEGTVFDIPWSFTEMEFNDREPYGVTYFYDRSKQYNGETLIFSLK